MVVFYFDFVLMVGVQIYNGNIQVMECFVISVVLFVIFENYFFRDF